MPVILASEYEARKKATARQGKLERGARGFRRVAGNQCAGRLDRCLALRSLALHIMSKSCCSQYHWQVEKRENNVREDAAVKSRNGRKTGKPAGATPRFKGPEMGGSRSRLISLSTFSYATSSNHSIDLVIPIIGDVRLNNRARLLNQEVTASSLASRWLWACCASPGAMPLPKHRTKAMALHRR
jgi:hypothetical protein